MGTFDMRDFGAKAETSELEKLWLRWQTEFDADFFLCEARFSTRERALERVSHEMRRMHFELRGYIWEERQPPFEIETEVEAVAVAEAVAVVEINYPDGWRASLVYELSQQAANATGWAAYTVKWLWLSRQLDRVEGWLWRRVKWKERQATKREKVTERVKGKAKIDLRVVYPNLRMAYPAERMCVSVMHRGGERTFHRLPFDTDQDRADRAELAKRRELDQRWRMEPVAPPRKDTSIGAEIAKALDMYNQQIGRYSAPEGERKEDADGTSKGGK